MSRAQVSSMNAFEHSARVRKVNAIVALLKRWEIVPDEAVRYTPEEWAVVARMVGVGAPSSVTVAAVLERLRSGRDLSVVEQLQARR
jgi:hypothetical protein